MDIYYEKAGEKIGPISFDKLEPNIISPDTLVWHNELSEWTKAKNLPELNEYLKNIPLPLPSKSERTFSEKYDTTYEKETDATLFGIGIIVLGIVAVFIRNLEGIPDFYPTLLMIIVGLIAIGSSVYACRTAKDQNRNQDLWAIFGFISPAIALIIIGQLPKLKEKKKSEFEKQLDEINSDKSL